MITARLTAFALAGTLALGCATPAPVPEHPLAGRLFSAPDGAELDREALARRLADADVIYLGEKHDNPHHHAAQLEVVRTLLARGRRPALGFEVVSLTRTSELVRYAAGGASPHAAGPEAAAERLRARLGWTEDDDHWGRYGALLALAREEGLRIAGIDLPRALRARISRVGIEGLSAVERMLLRDSGFDDPVYERLMHERFKEAHCGYGRPEHLARLYDNWLARNDTMAAAVAAMAAEAPGEPVVVILGGGHVLNDMGVYERVAARAPALRQLNLGLREVGAAADPGRYLAPLDYAGTRFAPPHQILWLTPPAPPAPDPCEAFREHMKKAGERPS